MTVMHTKYRPLRSLLAVAVFAVAGTAGAQQTQLNPQAKRISDEAIHADLQSYEATQGRIQALNDAGRPIRDYHLSKAQCWLDVSFHEYTRNDRSAFPQEALTESEKLIVDMENGVSPIPTDTALVNEAETAARLCGVDPAGPVVAPAPGPLIANVLFEFDRDGYKDIRTYSLESVDRALATIGSEQRELAGVTLVGHADRMQGHGFDYNQALSERRAKTVRELLIGRGVAADQIRYEYRGDTQQVQQCEGVKPRAALLECLLPNRRVEVRFELAK